MIDTRSSRHFNSIIALLKRRLHFALFAWCFGQIQAQTAGISFNVDIVQVMASCVGPACTFSSEFGDDATSLYELTFKLQLSRNGTNIENVFNSVNIYGNESSVPLTPKSTTLYTLDGTGFITGTATLSVARYVPADHTFTYKGVYNFMVERSDNHTRSINMTVSCESATRKRDLFLSGKKGRVKRQDDNNCASQLPQSLTIMLNYKMFCTEWEYSGLNCQYICTPAGDPNLALDSKQDSCVTCEPVTGMPICCNYNYGGTAECLYIGNTLCATDCNNTAYIISIVILSILCLLFLLLTILLAVLLIKRKKDFEQKRRLVVCENRSVQVGSSRRSLTISRSDYNENRAFVNDDNINTLINEETEGRDSPTVQYYSMPPAANVDSDGVSVSLCNESPYASAVTPIIPRHYHTDDSEQDRSVTDAIDDPFEYNQPTRRPSDESSFRKPPPDYNSPHQRKPVTYV